MSVVVLTAYRTQLSKGLSAP